MYAVAEDHTKTMNQTEILKVFDFMINVVIQVVNLELRENAWRD